MKENLSYTDAMQAAEKGQLVGRKEQLAHGVFICTSPLKQMTVGDVMKSPHLPKAAKDYFTTKYGKKKAHVLDAAPIRCLVSRDDIMIFHWQPTPADLQATDWCILDPKDIEAITKIE